MTDRYNIAVEALAATHKKDPNTTIVTGEAVPNEWLYIQRINERLELFEPKASEELRLAANCQHLRRWEIARADYPDGRIGYFEWRTYLAKYQSDKAAEIIKGAGYPEETGERLRSLIAKENLHENADSQTLEDVVCLVFMEYYLEDFAAKNSHLEFNRIILKTMNKMSERGVDEAKKMKFPADIQKIINQILL